MHRLSNYRSPRIRREKGPEKIFEEIIAENFPNMGKEITNQVQEAQIVPGRINSRRNTQRHIVIKLTKIKDRNKVLKATRQNIQRNSHQAISSFLNFADQKGMS